MNDEIKEILGMLNFNRDTISNGTCRIEDFMSREQIIKLLDYITNLQQENEKLLSENIVIKSVRNMVDETIYKSRCEKAVEYIKIELVDEWSIKNGGCVSGSDLPVDAITPLLNILNGKGEDNVKD